MIYLNKKRFGLYKIYVLYITCLIFVRKISLKILIGYIKSWYTKMLRQKAECKCKFIIANNWICKNLNL